MNPSSQPPNSPLLLPCLPNLLASEVTWLEPWDFAERPHHKFPDKDAYKAYIRKESTQSCLFSGVSGMLPSERISRTNPPTRLHAIVADYDTPLDEKKRALLLNKIAVKPSYISRSYSGGTHAIWLLEEPLPLLPDNASHHALLKAIAKDLKLNRAFGTLDETAFYNLSQIYHVGWEWQIGGGSPIPTTRAMLWQEAAMKKAKLSQEDTLVPLERVAEELHKRFPNRWEGDFTVGSRGCRFWDAQADNQSAAIVTEHGMVCFTGAQSFRSWKSIFGEEFLKQYEQDTIGAALKDCYFISNKFYRKSIMLSPCGKSMPSWQGYNRQNFESVLSATYGLRSKCDKERGEDESEVKRAVGSVIEQKALSGVVPAIYNDKQVIQMGDKLFLNTSFLRVMPPDESASTQWGVDFPWIAQFLESLFPDIIQRERFICEWAYAYKNAYHLKPKNGRTIIIAGETGVGKNFITEVLIGPSLGGFDDASSYLLGESRFNERLFETGVWILNDPVDKSDKRERDHFSKMLKKMAANMTHVVEGKFKDAAKIPWSGRIYITLNTDPISLSLLPEIDINNKDKMSLYRASGEKIELGADEKASKELPAFCNYLLHLEYPEHCIGDARWGVKGYLHPELLETAERSGKTATFEETLNMYVESVFEADKSIEVIACAATEWFTKLAGDEQTSVLVRHASAQTIGTQLGMLEKRGDYPIKRGKIHRGRTWEITREGWYAYMNAPTGDDLDETMPF